jgi:hypothetical protein
MGMRKITWAVLAWTVLWIAGVWAIDPASTVGGKPPTWAMFEAWAFGFVIFVEFSTGGLAVAAGRVKMDLRPLRSVPGAVLAWTALWMVVFAIWALDPAPTDVGMGPGPTSVASLKPSEPVLLALWALGLALLGAVWLTARSRGAGRRQA